MAVLATMTVRMIWRVDHIVCLREWVLRSSECHAAIFGHVFTTLHIYSILHQSLHGIVKMLDFVRTLSVHVVAAGYQEPDHVHSSRRNLLLLLSNYDPSRCEEWMRFQ